MTNYVIKSIDISNAGMIGAASGAISADITAATTSYVNGAVNINKNGIDVGPGDVRIQGESLKEFMDQVRERLGMLVPNPKLESEWEELRALAQQYRALEKELKDKAEVWDALKKDY